MNINDLEANVFYMCALFGDQTNDNIKSYADNISSLLGVDKQKFEYHITIAYSRLTKTTYSSLEKSIKINDVHEVIPNSKIELSYFPTNGKTTVILKVKNEYLNNRFQQVLDNGGTYDFDEYHPHVTILYDLDIDPQELEELPKFEHDLVIIKEKQEPVY